jgi:predicted GIY-YIG superfamily endonuclease
MLLIITLFFFLVVDIMNGFDEEEFFCLMNSLRKREFLPLPKRANSLPKRASPLPKRCEIRTKEERAQYDYENRTPLFMRDPGARLRKNPESKWYVYVMQLRGRFFYVGYTTDVTRRFRKHSTNPTNAFVKEHAPEKIVWEKCFYDDQEAALMKEDEVTIKLMKKFGIDRVRGGKFYKKILSESDIREIKSLLDV